MVSQTTKAFRKMMLRGRLNQLMVEGVRDALIETEKAHKKRFVPSIYMTPDSQRSPLLNQEQIDADFEVPDYVFKRYIEKKNE